jgi:cation transport regulator ChaB
MPAPKKDKEIFRFAIDAAWDQALEAQNRLDDASTSAEVATVAQAWATVAVAAKAVLR